MAGRVSRRISDSYLGSYVGSVFYQRYVFHGSSYSVYLLRKLQNTRTGVAGAEYHPARDCRYPQFIRPVLFAFFKYADQELKDFVKLHLDVAVWEDGIEAYTNWLTSPPGNDAPNLVKLYWWILMFWGRLPR